MTRTVVLFDRRQLKSRKKPKDSRCYLMTISRMCLTFPLRLLTGELPLFRVRKYWFEINKQYSVCNFLTDFGGAYLNPERKKWTLLCEEDNQKSF